MEEAALSTKTFIYTVRLVSKRGVFVHKRQVITTSVFFLLVVVLSSFAAADTFLVNSRDWRDVYSTVQYAELSDQKAKFLTSTNHAQLILNAIPKGDPLRVYSSQDNPFVANYESRILAEGFTDVEETVSDSINLDFARALDGINNYLIIDDSYGYNAIAAAPYAAVDNYYVLFADVGNIGDVEDFLNGADPQDIILFGQLDAEVKEALEGFNPTTINVGDRFENNMAIVDRYLEVRPTKQVVLTNGEFIEQSLMTGDDPVLFIGKANVPDKTRSYIADSDFEVAILIGNELIGTATFIRRQIGISVFVKFAQGARAPSGSISQVEDLDRFPMPAYDLLLSIDSAVYNSATNTLEITYKNEKALAAYFSSTVTVTPDNKTLQDDEPVFIDGDAFKTVAYTQLRDGSDFVLEALDAEAEITTFYGESPNALENTLIKTVPISRITVLDDSSIVLNDLTYQQSAQRFWVTVENTGPVDTYVLPEVVDVVVNDQAVTAAAEEPVFLAKGDSQTIPIKLKLSDADILDNENVQVRAYYGVRENALTKIVLESFPLKLVGADFTVYYVFAGVLVLVIILMLLRKECAVCKAKNPLHRKQCKRCRAPLKKKR